LRALFPRDLTSLHVARALRSSTSRGPVGAPDFASLQAYCEQQRQLQPQWLHSSVCCAAGGHLPARPGAYRLSVSCSFLVRLAAAVIWLLLLTARLPFWSWVVPFEGHALEGLPS
jgi:hypothetical protein